MKTRMFLIREQGAYVFPSAITHFMYYVHFREKKNLSGTGKISGTHEEKEASDKPGMGALKVALLRRELNRMRPAERRFSETVSQARSRQGGFMRPPRKTAGGRSADRFFSAGSDLRAHAAVRREKERTEGHASHRRS